MTAQKEAPRRKTYQPLLSICTLAFYLKKLLKILSKTLFIEKNHVSAYNTYIREKEKIGGSTASMEVLFVRLIECGIESRIVYSFRKSNPFIPLISIEIIMGGNVIVDGERDRHGVIVSVDCRKNIVNHSLYIPKRISDALNMIFPYCTSQTGKYLEYDTKITLEYPKTKKEAILHPMYCIDRKRKREVIYPRSFGGVTKIKERGEVSIGSNNTIININTNNIARKDKWINVYPISHLHKLLTPFEAEREGKRVIEGERPYRVILPAGKPSESTKQNIKQYIKLYAPWQLQPLMEKEGNLIVSTSIPDNHIYLIETTYIKYKGLKEIGKVPYIGRRYNTETQRMYAVREGLLLTKKAFEENKHVIKMHILNSIITQIVEKNQELIFNMQLFSKECIEYLDIFESLEKMA